MTFLLGAESPRRAGAREFGLALRRALVRRRVAKSALSVRAGVTRSSIANYCAGLSLPTMQTARKIAAELQDDGLLAIMARSREYICPIDKVRFIFNGQSRRTFCSPECQRVAEKMRVGTTVTKRADRAERRLALFSDAVAAMCRSCEPEGSCSEPGCALRAVSPLPIVLEIPRAV